MDILKEEMENDELHHRVNAIHRIKLIATILGPEGTKNQLMPYLESKKKKKI
jgi:serine/threonine-protein phosphatase 2A regulatory subunit A